MSVPNYNSSGLPVYDITSGKPSLCADTEPETEEPCTDPETWDVEDRGWASTVKLQEVELPSTDSEVVSATSGPPWDQILEHDPSGGVFSANGRWEPPDYFYDISGGGVKDPPLEFGDAVLFHSGGSATAITVECVDGFPRFTLQVYVEGTNGADGFRRLIFFGYKDSSFLGFGPIGTYANTLAWGPAQMSVTLP